MAGAMTVLLRDAIKPNLLQTLEGGPAFVHCRAVRQHRPRQQLDHRRPAGAGDQRHRLHRGRASGPTWAPRSSSTSSAGRRACARMRPSWSPRSGRSRCTAGSARSWPASRSTRRSSRRTSRRSGPGAANLAKQIENVRMFGDPGGRRDQLVPDRHARRGRGDPRGRARGRRPRRGGGRPTSSTAARARRPWPRRSGRPPRTGRARLPAALPGRGAAGREDRDDRHPDLRRRRRRADLPAAQQVAQAVRGARATATCRSAWPRRSTRSATTRRSRAARPASRSRSARSGCRPGAGFITPLCGEMRTMPGLPSRAGRREDRHRRRGNIVGLF